MMPAAIVFEGEVTGSPSRVPIGGVDNFTERRAESLFLKCLLRASGICVNQKHV